jgi:RNA polymerase sigma-70 factor, ECF subfamily
MLVGSDRHLAADVVQETMLRAWRYDKALLDEIDTALPWLYTVARHVVIDGHRWRASRPTEVSGATVEKIADREEIENMLTKVVIRDAFASLSGQHREVLLEVYYRRSNSEQAARALGIPPGTVRSRCHYALRALRLALQERGVTGQL